MTLDEVIEKARHSSREATVLKIFFDATNHFVTMTRLAREIEMIEGERPPNQALRINIMSMNSKFLTTKTGTAIIMTDGGPGRGLVATYQLTSRKPIVRDSDWALTRIMERTGIVPEKR